MASPSGSVAGSGGGSIVVVWSATDSGAIPTSAPPRLLAPSERPSPRPRAGARTWQRWVGRAFVLGVPLAYLAVLLVGPLLAVVAGAFADGAGAFLGAVTSRWARKASPGGRSPTIVYVSSNPVIALVGSL